MSARNEPEKLARIMDSVLSSRGYLNLCRESEIQHRWSDIVGEQVAGISECRGVENGVLYVRVASASWRQEMSFNKEQILSLIRARTRCTTVRDVVFC